MKKLLLLIVSVVFVVYPANATTPFSPNDLGEVEVSIMWWGGPSRAEALIAALDLFESRYPNVRVLPSFEPFSGYQELLWHMAADGDMPDIFQFSYPWLKELDARGQLLDLRGVEHIFDLTEIEQGPFGMDMTAFATAGGRVVAVPSGVNGRFFVYNLDFLNELGLPVPQTIDEFLYAGDIFLQTHNSPFLELAFGDTNTLNELILAWLYNKTGEPLITDGRITYSLDQVEQAFLLLEQLFESGVVRDIYDLLHTAEIWEWYEGSQNFIFSNHFGVTAITLTEFFDRTSGNLDYNHFTPHFAPFPSLANGEGQNVLLQPAFMVGISQHSAQPQLAVYLLNWLYTDKDALRLLGDTFGVPTTATAWELAGYYGLVTEPVIEIMQMFSENFGVHHPLTNFGFTAHNNLSFERIGLLDNLLLHRASPQQAAQDWIDRQNRTLLTLGFGSGEYSYILELELFFIYQGVRDFERIIWQIQQNIFAPQVAEEDFWRLVVNVDELLIEYGDIFFNTRRLLRDQPVGIEQLRLFEILNEAVLHYFDFAYAVLDGSQDMSDPYDVTALNTALFYIGELSELLLQSPHITNRELFYEFSHLQDIKSLLLRAETIPVFTTNGVLSNTFVSYIQNGFFYELQNEINEILAKIDVQAVQGSVERYFLYTFDIFSSEEWEWPELIYWREVAFFEAMRTFSQYHSLMYTILQE